MLLKPLGHLSRFWRRKGIPEFYRRNRCTNRKTFPDKPFFPIGQFAYIPRRDLSWLDLEMSAVKKFSRKRKTIRTRLAGRSPAPIVRAVGAVCARQIEFVDNRFKALRGRRARLLREDFCGTANVSCEVGFRPPRQRAPSVSISTARCCSGQRSIICCSSHASPAAADRPTLRKRAIKTYTDQPTSFGNEFRYLAVQGAQGVERYFRRVRGFAGRGRHPVSRRLWRLRLFQREIVEEQEIEEGGFTYVWGAGEVRACQRQPDLPIHFDFPDGSRLERAFSYDCACGLPEIRELVGGSRLPQICVYWQGWDERQEADGDFKPVSEGEADAGGSSYLGGEVIRLCQFHLRSAVDKAASAGRSHNRMP